MSYLFKFLRQATKEGIAPAEIKRWLRTDILIAIRLAMKTEGNLDANYLPRFDPIEEGRPNRCAFQFTLDKIIEELVENRLVPFDRTIIY